MNNTSTFSERFGVISIMDALGTKGIWKTEIDTNRLEKWSFLSTVYSNVINVQMNKNLKILFADSFDSLKPQYNFTTFSDTIILIFSIE